MFDSNQMRELAHLKAECYARNGGGGGFIVRKTMKAYYEAKGFRSRYAETFHYVRQSFHETARSAANDFRIACMCIREGIADNDQIPF